MNALTKAMMAETLFDELGFTKQEAKEMVEHFFEEIGLCLEQGEDVKFSRFGNFTLRTKKQRFGRNFKTGEESPVSARRVVTFKPGLKLKTKVREIGQKS